MEVVKIQSALLSYPWFMIQNTLLLNSIQFHRFISQLFLHQQCPIMNTNLWNLTKMRSRGEEIKFIWKNKEYWSFLTPSWWLRLWKHHSSYRTRTWHLYFLVRKLLLSSTMENKPSWFSFPGRKASPALTLGTPSYILSKSYKGQVNGLCLTMLTILANHNQQIGIQIPTFYPFVQTNHFWAKIPLVQNISTFNSLYILSMAAGTFSFFYITFCWNVLGVTIKVSK